MSNETLEQDQEMKEMEQQLEQAIAEEKAAKAVPETVPSPEPAPEVVPEAVATPEPTVTPQPSEPVEQPKADTTVKDDPMEWAKKKGLKTPEDMARLLRQKEQEFHQSRQKEQNQVPPQTWQPRPDNGYQPTHQMPAMPFYQPPQPRLNPREIAQYYPQLAPEDVERVMPIIVDAAEAISNRKMAAFEQRWGVQVGAIQRDTERNNELMTLMQDSAFRDSRVQKEVHEVLDSDPSIFQRERTPYAYAYEKALANMTRKQLQQGVIQETTPKNTPPVTAGGGNGSANTSPFKVTEQLFASWTDEQQDAYIKSNGRVLPRK